MTLRNPKILHNRGILSSLRITGKWNINIMLNFNPHAFCILNEKGINNKVISMSIIHLSK